MTEELERKKRSGVHLGGKSKVYVRFEDRRLPEKVCRSNFPTASRALSSHPVDRADDDSFRIR